MSIFVFTGCHQFFSSKPKKQTITGTFENERDSFVTIADCLKGLSYSSCFIDSENGTFFAEFSYHGICDLVVVASIKQLWECGCSHLTKNSINNSVAFELWYNNHELNCGILSCIQEGEESKTEYMTDLQEMNFPNWYYYVEDCNKWRLK